MQQDVLSREAVEDTKVLLIRACSIILLVLPWQEPWCLPRAHVQDSSNASCHPVACLAIGVLEVLHRTAVRGTWCCSHSWRLLYQGQVEVRFSFFFFSPTAWGDSCLGSGLLSGWLLSAVCSVQLSAALSG